MEKKYYAIEIEGEITTGYSFGDFEVGQEATIIAQDENGMTSDVSGVVVEAL